MLTFSSRPPSRPGLRTRHWAAFTLATWTGVTLGACTDEPTELLVEVYSDVPCDATVAVAAGEAGQLGNRPASATSLTCDPATGHRGRLVIVPEGSDTKEMAIEVRIRADQGDPQNCTLDEGYDGCIVARRIVNFVKQRKITLRVDLKNPCLNTPCDQTTSCVARGTEKACVQARIDPKKCADGVCTDDDLVTQSPDVFNPCGPGTNPCDSRATCQVRTGGLACVCPNGFVNSPTNPHQCVEERFEPCAPDMNPCDERATCQVQDEGVVCVCPEGFTNSQSDPSRCENVDECLAGIHECDPHAVCTDSEGSYLCTCLPAYSGDGRTCEQVECEQTCPEHATCTAVDSGFECQCDAGYEPDGAACRDIDECTTGAHDCVAPATCVNEPEASFSCACPGGYRPVGTTACEEIDECADGTDNCDAVATCTNAPAGSFTCMCPEGYEGDGTTCTLACVVAPPGLSAWFTGETNFTDRIAGLSGTPFSGAAVGAAGMVNGAFDLTAPGSYVEVADDPALDVGTGDFSIATWIRTTQGGGPWLIADKRTTSSPYTGYHFWLYDNRIGVQLSSNTGSPQNILASGGNITDGEWHHVVLSVERGSATGLRFFVDGVAHAASPSASTTGLTGSLDTAVAFRLGTNLSGTSKFSGHLDEFQLYKSALTEDQARALHAAGSLGVCR